MTQKSRMKFLVRQGFMKFDPEAGAYVLTDKGRAFATAKLDAEGWDRDRANRDPAYADRIKANIKSRMSEDV